MAHNVPGLPKNRDRYDKWRRVGLCAVNEYKCRCVLLLFKFPTKPAICFHIQHDHFIIYNPAFYINSLWGIVASLIRDARQQGL